MNLIIYTLLLSAYYALHSLLADNKVKEILFKIIPMRFYRLFYNIVSITLLIGLIFYFKALPSAPLFASFSIVGMSLLIIGGIVLLLSVANYDFKEFTGLYQLNNQGASPKHSLVRKGLNKWVRHPLYVGVFSLVIGLFLYLPTMKTVIVGGVTIVYLFVGTWLEEKKLIGEFGASYIKYKEEVGKFFPKLF